MSSPDGKQERVDLLGTVTLLHTHLTDALSQDVFEEHRTTERKRLWTLDLLLRFWTAVVLRAPPSLRHALAESRADSGSYPAVEASAQAFFARCQNLRWEFFQAVFERFRERLVQHEPPGFAAPWRDLGKRFTALWIVDGSRLDAVARRLKVLWNDRAVPLPGSLLAFYDLERGILGKFLYDADAARSELKSAITALSGVAKGTLIIGDRLYGVPQLFAALSAHSLFGVCRRNKVAKIQRQKRISKRSYQGGVLEDWEVALGVTAGEPLRLVRWKKGKTVREVLTNVLDPQRLTAQEAMDLYPQRWKVERLFYDLKEVLNLHKFYGANVNAVAMQVYAAATVHTAMRVAQGRIAKTAGIEAEGLSPQKLFPKIAVASITLVNAEAAFEATKAANPRIDLVKPDWSTVLFTSVPLRAVLKEPRKGARRKRRYCASRKTWRSLPAPPGG